MIKTLDFQINNCENNLREYCNKTITTNKKQTTENLNNMNMRITEVKMENNKYSYELKKNSDTLLKEIDSIAKLKDDINWKYESFLMNVKAINQGTNDNFDDLKVEFNNINNKFGDLSEFIKVILVILNLRM